MQSFDSKIEAENCLLPKGWVSGRETLLQSFHSRGEAESCTLAKGWVSGRET